MKYKSKIYAQALVDSLSDKVNQKKITDNFLKLLEKNGDMKKAREIILQAEQLFLKKTGNKKVVLEVARKVNTKDFTKNFIKKGDLVKEKINAKLIAGVKILINNERQLDNSLLGKLNKII